MDIKSIEELKSRLADRFTASELTELLNVAVEDIIDIYLDQILDSEFILKEVGMVNEE